MFISNSKVIQENNVSPRGRVIVVASIRKHACNCGNAVATAAGRMASIDVTWSGLLCCWVASVPSAGTTIPPHSPLHLPRCAHVLALQTTLFNGPWFRLIRGRHEVAATLLRQTTALPPSNLPPCSRFASSQRQSGGPAAIPRTGGRTQDRPCLVSTSVAAKSPLPVEPRCNRPARGRAYR